MLLAQIILLALKNVWLVWHIESSTIEPGFNDISLYDTSFLASDILWYQLLGYNTIRL
jgi:hypothetical protein